MARKLVFDVSAIDRLSGEMAKMAAAVQLLTRAAARLDRTRVDVDVDVDTTRAQRNLGAFADDAQRRLGRAFSALPEGFSLEGRLIGARSALRNLSNQRIGIDIDGDEAFRQISAIAASLRTLAATSPSVTVRVNAAAALAELLAIKGVAEALDRMRVEVDVEVDRDRDATRTINDVAAAAGDGARRVGLLARAFQRLISAASAVRSLGILAVPTAIASASPAVISLIGSLKDLLGLLGLLPALSFGAIAGFAAVAVGIMGLGDVLKDLLAGDMEAFNHGLRNLAPSAQEFALALKEVLPAFSMLRIAVQQRLFEGIGQDLFRLSTTYLPTLQAGLVGVAASISDGVRAWAEWATGAEVVRQTGGIFENLRASIAAFAPGMRDLAAALTDITEVGMRMGPRLARSFSEALAGFRDFIREARDNGQLFAWIQRGIDTLNQMARILGNLGGAFGGLATAVDLAGGSFLDTLERMTERLDTFVNSVEGQASLIAFFTTVRGILAELGEALIIFGRALGEAFIVGGPGLLALAQAFTSIVAALAPAIPLIASFANVLGPIALLIANVVQSMGPWPAIIVASMVAFRILAAIVAALIGTLTALAGRLATLAGAAGLGALATVATGLGVTLINMARWLTGPWGIAILGAAAVIGILVGSQDRGAEAAARHQAAVSSLAGTFDLLSGAMTRATREQQVREVVTRTLSDGTTKLTTALREAGISTTDFTKAVTGSRPHLESVTQQLVSQTRALLLGDDAMAASIASAGRYGASMELIVAAVLGNVQAQDQLRTTLQNVPGLYSEIVDGGREVVGNLDEIGEHLGDLNGQFGEAALQARLTAQSMADFEGSLTDSRGALSEFGDIIDDVTARWDPAAEGATQLQESLSNLARDAQLTAQGVGDMVAAQDGIAAGAAAAGAEMQVLRNAFVNMAIQAGLSEVAAEALATTIGLIPAVAATNFEMNADLAQQEINTIIARIQAVPDSKEIIVTSLTDEAASRLRALGIQVEQLEDGTIRLTLDDDGFQADLNAAIALGLSLPEFLILLGLDPAPAEAELDALRAKLEAAGIDIPVHLDDAQAEADLRQWEGTVGGLTLSASLDTGPADAELEAFRGRAGAALPMPQLDLDTGPAETMLASLRLNAQTPMILTLNNEQPLAAIGEVVAAGLAANTEATHTQLTDAALAAIAAVVAAGMAAATTAEHTHLNAAALAAIAAVVAAGNSAHTTAGHTQTDNVDAVLARIRSLNGQDTFSTHTITTVHRTIGGGPGTGANILGSGGAVRFARGGIVPGYAPGIDRVPALLSPGESVLVPELTRMLGAKTIHALNKMASGGRRAAMISRGGNRMPMPSMQFGAFGRGGSTGGNNELRELIHLLRTRPTQVVVNAAADPVETAQTVRLLLRMV